MISLNSDHDYQWLHLVKEYVDKHAREFQAPIATHDHRFAAVLINLVNEDQDVHVTLIERAHTDGEHAGQVAFPGGRVDPQDATHVETALREAREEIGLRTETLDMIGPLTPVWLAPTRYWITPVVSHWRDSHELIVDEREVHSVYQVSLRSLAHPDTRLQVRAPNGFVGPAFETDTHLIWGFTAGLLAEFISVIQYDEPWDTTRIRDVT